MSPKAPRGIELTLPDLPEVPISLGPAAGGGRFGAAALPWPLRLREALASALPLLLMVLLAVGSWWLVRNAPQPLEPRPPAATRVEPDYTMTGFMVQRFGADGRLRLQIEGRQLRHLPAAGRLEIEGATIRAFAPDGRETVAIARLALADDKTTEVQLIGGARCRRAAAAGKTRCWRASVCCCTPRSGVSSATRPCVFGGAQTNSKPPVWSTVRTRACSSCWAPCAACSPLARNPPPSEAGPGLAACIYGV